MKTARTLREFYHNFGPGAGNLSVTVDADSLCSWHESNGCWYVLPGQVPVYAQHDANYRGIPVPVDNLKIDGEEGPVKIVGAGGVYPSRRDRAVEDQAAYYRRAAKRRICLGTIQMHEGAICLAAGKHLFYPLEGSSGIAEDFRNTFGSAKPFDIGKRVYRDCGVLVMENATQRDERIARDD